MNACSSEGRDLIDSDLGKTPPLMPTILAGNKRDGDFQSRIHHSGDDLGGASQMHDAEVDCPCKSCTPAGTEPMSTRLWMERRLNGAESGMGISWP